MQINQGQSLLSSSTSVDRYLEMELQKDIEGISKFIYERFNERYIKPFINNKNKSGFIMMASACLMIEALESFWHGWRRSPNSGLAFCQFFDRNGRFILLQGLREEFYVHVRCGIMHQGETTGGWHIRRDGREIFNSQSKTIDATKFLKEMDGALNDYCELLKNTTWSDKRWLKFRKKMKSICENTNT